MKKPERDIAFAQTYDENTKDIIEKAFLKHGVSYLIKMDKERDRNKGLFEKHTKYSFYVNRYQEEEAKSAMQGDEIPKELVTILVK